MPDSEGTGRERLSGDRLRLVLMGTGPFAVPSFDALRAAGHTCLQVITRPRRLGPGKRAADKSPVRHWAESRGLPVSAPESINAPEAVEALAGLGADLLVVCDFGQILRPAALATAPLGGINLHGSLLPAYRGAAPVQWAILNGDPVTGVSVIHMTPVLDAGPVIVTRPTPIGPRETAGELEQRLALLGVEATLEAVQRLSAGSRSAAAPQSASASPGQPQDPARTSRAPRLSKSDGRILWTRPAEELDWHVRGMQPWPGAFTEVPPPEGRRADPQRLVVLELELTDQRVEAAVDAGVVAICDGQLWVAAGDRWVILLRVKPAGKREMAAEEWLRGRPLKDGTILR